MSLLPVVFAPLLMAPLAYVAGRLYGRRAGYLPTLATLAGLAVVILYYPQVASGGTVVTPLIWTHVAGTEVAFSLRMDGFSLVFALSIAAVGSAVSLYSIPYMGHRFEEMGIEGREGNRAYAEYYLLYLLFYAGMIGTVLSSNVIQFYIFYEIILLSTWLLIHAFGYGKRERIALTYFVWTQVSGLLVLIGFVVHYMSAGSVDVLSYGAYTAAMPFLLLGFAIKMSVFGLHLWLPPAHGEAPTPISALLSPVTIGIGAYAIIRFVQPLVQQLSPWILAWAMVTILYGGLVALSEDDIKRLLAYSSISHMGYMLLGIASVTWIGFAGVSYHYLSHAFLKAVLFMTAGLLMMQMKGNRRISLMGGLAARTPWAAVFMVSGFLGLAGFPPFAGFNSKLLIFAGAFQSPGDYIRLAMVAGAVLASFLTLGYGALTFKRAMLGEAREGLEVKEPDMLMVASIAFLLILAVAFFFVPWLVIQPLLGASA
ncbi:MAG: NADH dehydrogenase [Candidatus Verstraetearchaeota archaeon]|nr:NADH dehydrogenase [Candidatus Verstraetearchaeota archaeon]